MNYIYILYTQAPNIRYLQNKTWKWKSEINVQCCWCTPSLGWNQFAKRFVREGHLYSVYLVYLVYGEGEQKWEPQFKENMYFSATAMSKSRTFINCMWRMNEQSGKLRADPGKRWSPSLPLLLLWVSMWARGSSALLRIRALRRQQYELEREDHNAPHFLTVCVCSC